jgi:hypothetical protein
MKFKELIRVSDTLAFSIHFLYISIQSNFKSIIEFVGVTQYELNPNVYLKIKCTKDV